LQILPLPLPVTRQKFEKVATPRANPRLSLVVGHLTGTGTVTVHFSADPAINLELSSSSFPAVQVLPAASTQNTKFPSQIVSPEELKASAIMAASDKPTVLIPGPVEFDDAVLGAMSHPRYERLPILLSLELPLNPFCLSIALVGGRERLDDVSHHFPTI
jgi:hypothetical protein